MKKNIEIEKEIKVARHAGFCFGVKRAMEMAEEKLASGNQDIYIIGSLVHNDQVMERLAKKGLKKVASISEIPDEAVLIIRSHGSEKNTIDEACRRKMKIIDATCPFVSKARIVAENFRKKGYEVVICGDAKHAEVIGINSWIENQGRIIGDPQEISKVNFEKNVIGVLSQTTYKNSFLQEVVGQLLKSGRKHVVIENTICSDSVTKQDEIRELAKEVDVLIVVGGKLSSNTNKLAEVGRTTGVPTYHVEIKEELKKDWFGEGVRKVGVAAGASTAQFLIDEIVKEIEKMMA